MAKETKSDAPNVSPDIVKSNEIARKVMGSGVRPEGFKVEYRNGTTTLSGTVASEDEKKRVLDTVRGVSGVGSITDSLKVGGGTSGTAGGTTSGTTGAATGGARTYTVKSGDTLSKIAKAHYGDASAYTRIFEANRNILTDPDKIKPGQELKIP